MNNDLPEPAEDENLTAYALSESAADGANHVAPADTLSAYDAAAVQQIKRCGELLRAAAKSEPYPSPSPDLRQLVEARLSEPLAESQPSTSIPSHTITSQTTEAPAMDAPNSPIPASPRPSRRTVWFSLALAATICIAVTIAIVANGSKRYAIDTPQDAFDVDFTGGVSRPVWETKSKTEPQEFDALTELITETVQPETWDESGGPDANAAPLNPGAGMPAGLSAGGQAGERGAADGYRSLAKKYGGQIRDGRGLPARAGVIPGDESARGSMGVEAKFASPVTVSNDADEPIQNNVFGRDGRDLVTRADGEGYAPVEDNPFFRSVDRALSTFSIDVDTASYSNVRRFLRNGSLPPPAAVRIEELVNYFNYDYPQPTDETPFSVHSEVAQCPWAAGHLLLKIGLQGKDMAAGSRPASNLVFLIDVSGSMDEPNKLPLVKESMKLLVRQLTENDRVAIVVYAGESGLVLPSTTGNNQQAILDALDSLHPGGSTNGASGLNLAYDVAMGNFKKEGVNRVVLATDGDFNVGVTSNDQLVQLIEDRAAAGVFFSCLGYGMGNLKDDRLELLADKGNGNYGYIDTLAEAHKLLVEQMVGTLVTIAKDVKIQVEFNPARVAGYRLIGYENRILRDEDFNNDAKDAGEVGAGHTVTALYEIVPVAPAEAAAAGTESAPGEKLKYQRPVQAPQLELTEAAAGNELLNVKLRYKAPDGQQSKLLEHPVADVRQAYGQASTDFQFAAAVAAFGMLLRDSPHAGTASLDAVLELATPGKTTDEHGYRLEFVELVRLAKSLRERP